jgi:hypothetical protein
LPGCPRVPKERVNSPHDHLVLRVDLVGSHGRWKGPCLQTAHMPYDIESGPGGLTREVERPLPSNSPHDHMILRVDLVDSHARRNGPCLQTTPDAIRLCQSS